MLKREIVYIASLLVLLLPIKTNGSQIKIGVAQDLSGPANIYGKSIIKGTILAVKQINTSRYLGQTTLKMILEDTQGNEDQAKKVFYKLINTDKVVAIIGPTLSSSAFDAGWLAEQAKIPMITSSATADGITTDIGSGKYIFRTALPDRAVIPNTIKQSKQHLKLKKIAVIYDEKDDFSRLSYKLFAEALVNEAMDVITVETIRTGDTDFSAQLTRIQKQQPDAIIISALGTEVARIMKQARELGIPETVKFIGGDGFNSPKLFGTMANGAISGAAWHITSPVPESQDFVNIFREEYSSNPDQFAAQAYTAVQVLATAIINAKSTNPTKIRNALEAMNPIPSPLGSFKFTKEGEPDYLPVVQVMKDGEFILLHDALNESTTLTDTIKIGAAHALSGGASIYGQSIRSGIDLAVKQINERKFLGKTILEVIWKDTGTDKFQARKMFSDLINQHNVSAILGPTLSNSAFEADPVAQEAGVPVVASSNTAKGITDMGEYIFRTCLSESAVIPFTIRVTKDLLGLQRVAVMYDENDASSVSGYEVFVEALQTEGLEIIVSETLKTGDDDFSAQLTKIKKLNPDAIVVSTLAVEAAKIMQQAHQLGIPEYVRFIGGWGFNSPKVFQLGGKDANRAISGSAWNINNSYPASRQFVTDFKDEYGTLPDQFAAQSHTAVLVLAAAIRKANSSDRTEIRDALTEIGEIKSPLGPFSFDKNREPVHEPMVQVMDNGKFVLLK